MNLFIGLQIGLKEIWAHKFRSFLTMLGVILGVASLLAMFSLTAGMAKGMRETLMAVGGIEKVGISDKAPSVEREAMADASPGRTMKDVEALRAGAPLISNISPESELGGARIACNANMTTATVVGGLPDYFIVNMHTLGHGRLLSDLDEELASRVVVIGSGVVADLWPDEPNTDPVGKVININQRPFTVVGVLERYIREQDKVRAARGVSGAEKQRAEKRGGKQKGGGDMRDPFRWKNQAVVIPISAMFLEFKSANVVKAEDQGPNFKLSQLNLRIDDVTRFEEALAQVSNVLNTTHRGVDDFGFDTREDWFDRIETSVKSTRITGGIIAGISLLVGGIGITNIMLASITERVREIGIRRAIGARARDIFVQIIVESTVTAVIGGLIGLVVSVLMIRLIIALAPSDNVPIMEAGAVLVSFGFAFLIGIFSGIYPAWKASTLDPIQALRYE